MTTDNPLLAASGLPPFRQIRPEHVEPAIDAILADYRQVIDTITRPDTPADIEHVLLPQERMEQRLSRAFAPVGHLHAVADTPELRKAYMAALEKVTVFAAEMGQNRALYETTQALAKRATTGMPRTYKAALAHALRDFRLAGVALEEPARSRFRDIARQLSALGTDFANAVLDATDAWQHPITDERELAGIPNSGRAILRQYARDHGRDGYLVTLQQPAVQAVLTYADSRTLRETVYRAYQTRASDQGPDAGRYDNSGRIEQIMALRHEAATLLGFVNAAEESLATKMADSTATVMAFLDDLVARARPVAQRELEELRDYARDSLGLAELAAWDVAWASEKLRRERHAFDEEQLRPYFPVPAVIKGAFTLANRLYGIHLVARTDVDTWHPDVRYYEARDATDRVFAGLYLDLYARAGKRGGAWMDVCRARFRDGDQLQLPVAFLTCNFAPPTDAGPALVTHDDVLTLFHEFGHCLHHLLTEVDVPSVGGIEGVEWDAVELPSQFMENFCWDRGTLDLFAHHYRTGERLPQALFERMLAARHYHAGMFLVRQLEFALFDFRLHLEYDPARGARTMAILEDVRHAVAVVHPPAWQRFAHAFTHIFGGGYAAGYYSYLWAEVLSADAFSRFEEAGVIDAATGAAFRREILAMGATRPALENFIAFRGREPRPDALLKSYGLA